MGTWLAGPDGASAIAAAEGARSTHSGNALAAGTALRRARPDLSAEQAAAAMEQAVLRAEAVARYGLLADGLLLTRDGLEQATRPAVARQRAAQFVEQGARRVLDLTAGLGFDLQGFAAAGLEATGLECDPTTAAFCAVNVPGATVVVGDATDTDLLAGLLAALGPQDVVFVDPARRSGTRDLATGRARPERDPEQWSPPWSAVAAIGHPRIAVKTAPGFEPPRGWQGTWTSVDRVLVECLALSWPALPAARRAVCHDATGWSVLDGPSSPLPLADDVGTWLIEPDDAVLRADLTGALALPDLARLDDRGRWLTSSSANPPQPGRFGRAYGLTHVLPPTVKQQRAVLRELGITRLTVKTKDTGTDPKALLRELGCREGAGATLVQARMKGRTFSALVDPSG